MVTIIGDVHGKTKRYLEITKNCEYSVQIGDFSFNYDDLGEVDPNKHKIIGGNHCNYPELIKLPHYLGDFGYTELGGLNFFFIRGADSIDKKSRVPGKDWFPEEQLNFRQQMECFQLYKEICPKVVLSHDGPPECSKYITDPNPLRSWGINPETYRSPTQDLLQCCFDYWQPEFWVFGHYHVTWQTKIGCTKFYVLDELEVLFLED